MKDDKLIPFDLDAALRGEPVKYRNGSHAKFVAHVPDAIESARVLTCDAGGFIKFHYTSGGSYFKTELDLFMAPKPVEQFINIYPHGAGNYPQSSLEESKNSSATHGISVCKLTILNGEVIAHETVHRY